MTEDHNIIMRSERYFEKLRTHYTKRHVIDYFDDFIAFSTMGKGLVLDCGCGIGYFSDRLKKAGNIVVNLDFNYDSLSYGKKTYILDNAILADINNLPLRHGKFDAIYLLDVLEHLTTPDRVLRHLYHLLKPGGILVIITPNGVYEKILRYGHKRDHTHVQEFIWPSLKRLLCSLGFEVVSHRPAGLPLLNKIDFRLARNIASILPEFCMVFASPSFWLVSRKFDFEKENVTGERKHA